MHLMTTLYVLVLCDRELDMNHFYDLTLRKMKYPLQYLDTDSFGIDLLC